MNTLKTFLVPCCLLLGVSFILLGLQPPTPKAVKEQEAQMVRLSAELKQAELAKDHKLKAEFIQWLQVNAGAETGRFDGDTLEVRFAHGWPSKDHARVKAEALALAWRLRSRTDYARCNIYFGNEIYATGVSR